MNLSTDQYQILILKGPLDGLNRTSLKLCKIISYINDIYLYMSSRTRYIYIYMRYLTPITIFYKVKCLKASSELDLDAHAMT